MNEKQLEKFKKAKDEVKNHDFNTATDILLDLYDETDDQQVVLLLGETLFMDQKYVGANRFVEDNFDVFLQQNFELLTRIYPCRCRGPLRRHSRCRWHRCQS